MPNFEIENSLKGFVAGIDEAGRGPWAGPVVAGSVIILDKNLPQELMLGLNDSKKLSASKRQKLYQELYKAQDQGKICIGIGQASPEEIDDINILQATFLAMQRATNALSITPDIAIIDGNRCPQNFSCPSKSIIKGDAISLSISAASIVAKVFRDNLMQDLAKKYPYYSFEKNAGYGTKAHVLGLEQYGITPQHRKSYKPIKAFL